jgi:alanine racemase
MDQCMIDVTGLPVSVGDQVTLFGVSANELAALAARGGTIEHEVLCLISSRIPRIRV